MKFYLQYLFSIEQDQDRTSDREKAAGKHFAGGNAAKNRLYSPVSLISPDFFLTFTRKMLAPSIFRTS